MDTLFDGFLLSVPLVVPLFAFVLYPQVTMVYHFVVEIIFGKFVGDRAAQVAELLPVTNGIVVPSAEPARAVR